MPSGVNSNFCDNVLVHGEKLKERYVLKSVLAYLVNIFVGTAGTEAVQTELLM